MSKVFVVFLLLASILLCDGFGFATQDSTGRESWINFSVIVQTGSKERVPDAKVVASDEKGKAQTCVTDRNGRCRFERFRLGRIKISVTATGFAAASINQALVNKQEVAIALPVSQ